MRRSRDPALRDVHLHIATWNANRVSFDRFEEMIKELVLRLGRRIFLIQEVCSWPPNPDARGWAIIHAAGGYSASLIPSELAVAIHWERNAQTCAMAIIG